MFVEDHNDIKLFNQNILFDKENPKQTNNLVSNSPSPKSRRDSIKRVARNKEQEQSGSKKKNRGSMFVHSSDMNDEIENSNSNESKQKRGSLQLSNFSPVSRETRKSVFSSNKSSTQPVNVQVIRLSGFKNQDNIKKATNKKKRIIEDMNENKPIKKQNVWIEVSFFN